MPALDVALPRRLPLHVLDGRNGLTQKHLGRPIEILKRDVVIPSIPVLSNVVDLVVGDESDHLVEAVLSVVP